MGTAMHLAPYLYAHINRHRGIKETHVGSHGISAAAEKKLLGEITEH